ncbi:MAG: hypothetical protein R3C15_06815 [Thermoleophilia bacterium]
MSAKTTETAQTTAPRTRAGKRLGRRLALLAVCATAIGVAAPVASAQTSGDQFYWSAQLAKHRLLNQDLFFDDGVGEDVVAAQCRGVGAFIWNNTRTLRLFKKHRCAVATAEGNTYLLRVNVRDRFAFRFTVLQVF